MFLQKPLKPSPQASTCPTPLWAASPTAESLQACPTAPTPHMLHGRSAQVGSGAVLDVPQCITGAARSLAWYDAQLMDEGSRDISPRIDPHALRALMQEGRSAPLAPIGGPQKPPEDQAPTVKLSFQAHQHHLQLGNPSEESRLR